MFFRSREPFEGSHSRGKSPGIASDVRFRDGGIAPPACNRLILVWNGLREGVYFDAGLDRWPLMPSHSPAAEEGHTLPMPF